MYLFFADPPLAVGFAPAVVKMGRSACAYFAEAHTDVRHVSILCFVV